MILLLFIILVFVFLFSMISFANKNNQSKAIKSDIYSATRELSHRHLIDQEYRNTLNKAHDRFELIQILYHDNPDLIWDLPLSWQDDIDKYNEIVEKRKRSIE